MAFSEKTLLNVMEKLLNTVYSRFQIFHLEAHSSCRFDYLDIFDGPSTSSPLIGRFCGNVVPTERIRSTSNMMTLNFITDASVTHDGFRGIYRSTYGKFSEPRSVF